MKEVTEYEIEKAKHKRLLVRKQNINLDKTQVLLFTLKYAILILPNGANSDVINY